jgi:hypothetical protein
VTSLVPKECGSDEEHARYYHDDVATLDPIEARVELRRIEVALVTSHRHQHVVEREWPLERHARLDAYLHRRSDVEVEIVLASAPAPPPRRRSRIADEFRSRRREWS